MRIIGSSLPNLTTTRRQHRPKITSNSNGIFGLGSPVSSRPWSQFQGYVPKLNPINRIRFAAEKQFTYGPEENLVVQLKSRAEKLPDELALEVAQNFQSNSELTYKVSNQDLYTSVLRVARALKEQYHVKAGDRVAALETNTPEFVQLFYATLALGASVVSINNIALMDPLAKGPQLAHMIDVSDIKALFVGKDKIFSQFDRLKASRYCVVNKAVKSLAQAAQYIPNLSQRIRLTKANLQLKKFMIDRSAAGLKIITSKDTNGFKSLLAFEPLKESELNLTPQPNQEAMVLFTSGTTAMPKGVPLSHASLIHTNHYLKSFTQDVLPITSQDNLFLALPFFHIFGIGVFLLGITSGAKITLLPSLMEGGKRPDKMLDALKREKITLFPIIPGILKRMLNRSNLEESFKSVRVLISGGEKLPLDLFQKLKAANSQLKTMEGYGMTEIGIAFLNKTGQYGHVGKPISPFINLELRNPSPEGAGEIWVHTPSLGTPYLKASQEQIDELFKPDGWAQTGDIGQFDEHGNLKIVGRSKEIIKRNGEILSPEDFDIRLKEFLPIKDAITFAYTPPGKDTEKVVSIILLPQNSTETSKSLFATLQKKVDNKKLAPRYLPHFILPLKRQDFPEGIISGAGKKQYKEARSFLKKLQEQHIIAFSDKELQIHYPNKL